MVVEGDLGWMDGQVGSMTAVWVSQTSEKVNPVLTATRPQTCGEGR